MSWTDERIEKLTKMWEGGATASQIAEELGGVSRNAVIGKAHRLGLKARPSPVKANEKPARAPAPKKAKPASEAPPAPAAPAAPSEARPAPAAPARAPAAARPQAPAPAPEPETEEASDTPASDKPRIVSVGPGGFLRQGPGDQQPPIPPAPPRRLVPAKPSPEIADKTSLLDLNDRICRWPMGTRVSRTSTSAATRSIRASRTASSIAAGPTRHSCRAVRAVPRRRCPSAVRACAEAPARHF
ncbi:cell cycle regulator GcrA [Novosphingobium sp. MBES04]|nr:cell cycle regulator GcrA [Novosphingobium sp. MBES04]